MTASFAPRCSRTREPPASNSSGSAIEGWRARFDRSHQVLGTLERVGGHIPLQSVILSGFGHQGYQIVGVNELVPETGIGLGIEDLLEPVDDDLVTVRVPKFLVIGKPEVG